MKIKRDTWDWLTLIAMLAMLLGLNWLDNYLEEKVSQRERIERIQQQLAEPKLHD